MLMWGLILFGEISFRRMGISHLPDVNFPVVNIALEFDNAAPEIHDDPPPHGHDDQPPPLREASRRFPNSPFERLRAPSS
jgi:hypothetical protein